MTHHVALKTLSAKLGLISITSMVPSLLKSPVIPVPGLPVLAGLMCSYPSCGALFSDFEKLAAHAQEHHSGISMAITCAVQELRSASGAARLLHVLEESGGFGESPAPWIIPRF